MVIKNILVAILNMVWEIYWPLALGFIFSALIRTYISTSAISSRLGKSNVKGLVLSTFFGAISSSCSYAAASMSRTLIIKGASWANAVAFMIASTNLVFEIFLVIVTLLGWAFFGGEVLGGLLFIIMGALLIKLFISKASIQRAKEYIQHKEAGIQNETPGSGDAHPGAEEASHDHQYKKANIANHGQSTEIAANEKTNGKAKGAAWQKWKDATGYFYMDVKMVGQDILIGVLIASVLSVVVPKHLWQTLFLQNETHLPQFVIILWNAIIGIVVGLLAFVCSVGNILLAAVLWHGGINFGGVIAFILADLITIPMLMVYRNYYGIKMMWRLLFVLVVAILITSVSVDYIFQWAGWIPQSPISPIHMQMEGIRWNYKAILNIIFIPLSVIGFFAGKRAMKGD